MNESQNKPQSDNNGFPLFGDGLSLAGLAMLAVAFITTKKRKDK